MDSELNSEFDKLHVYLDKQNVLSSFAFDVWSKCQKQTNIV